MSTAGKLSTSPKTIVGWLGWMRDMPAAIEHDGMEPIALRPPDRAVLMALVLHVDGTGRSFPSISTIQRVTGLSRRTVFYALNNLVGAGVLMRHSGAAAKRSSSTYFLLAPPQHPRHKAYQDVLVAGGTADQAAAAMHAVQAA